MVCQISDDSRVLTKLQHRINRTGRRKINRIEVDELLRQADKIGLKVKHIIRYGLMLPGMGILPNRLLFMLNSWSIDNPRTSGFVSEAIIWFDQP